MKDSSFSGSVSLTLRATRCPCGPWPSKTPQKVVSSLMKSYNDSMYKDIDLQMKIKYYTRRKTYLPNNHGILVYTLATLLSEYTRTPALSIGENPVRYGG